MWIHRVFNLFSFLFASLVGAQSVEPGLTPGTLGLSPMEGRFATSPERVMPTSLALPALPKTAVDSDKPVVGGRIQIGTSRSIDIGKVLAKGSPTQEWVDTGDGKTSLLDVSSEGAEALRVALLVESVPKGLRIRVGSRTDWERGGRALVLTDEWMTETYGVAPFILWTPVSEGANQIVEFQLPASEDPIRFRFGVQDVSHLYDSPFRVKPDPKLLSCNQNYSCSTDPIVQQSGKAVAKLIITKSGSTFVCSGSLLNDRGSTGTPYFATANHCLSTAQEASSLQFLWFFEQTCNATTTNPGFTTTVGSQRLYTDASVDFTFLRVTGALPGGLVTLGWNTVDVSPGESVYGIHHPDGARKAFSTGQQAGILPSLTFRGSTASETWNISANAVYWAAGITEGGSSGSPLMTGNGVFRGALSAGPTTQTCITSPRVAYYSRFSQIFPRIREFLDPGAQTPDEPNSAAATLSTQPSSYTTGTLNGQIHFAGDQDWFRFDFPQRGVWIVLTLPDGSNPSTDTVGRIYGADGATLQLENDNDPDIAPNFGIVGHGGPGTFYLQVTGKGSATGKYLLVSIFVPDDDHSNFLQLATSLGTSANTSGRIDYGGDTDYFVIDVASSGMLEITSNGGTDVVGLLYNSANQLIASNDDVSTSNRNFRINMPVTQGRYYLKVIGYDVDVLGTYSVRTTLSAGTGAANYQDVWWGGTSQNGWGLNIAQHGNTLVGGWYVFGPDNQPTYLIMQGGTWNPSFTTFTGPLIQPVSGAPFSNYNPSLFVPGPTVGSMSLTFSDVNNATMSYIVNGVTGTKTISRLQYGSGTATASYADVWSGGVSQNGWGIAIAQQGATLVAGWYTFGTNGKPIWYILNGGTWLNTTTYRGPLITGAGAPVVGTVYTSSTFAARSVGELTLVFSDANNATMTYTVDGVTQSKQITRLAF